MAVRLTIDTTGEPELATDMLELGERADDVSPVLAEIADDFERAETRLFDTQGGGRWAPLKPSTVAAKAAAGLDPRILHATGALRDSLTKQGAQGAVRRITSDDFEAGTAVPYARYLGRRRPPIVLREQEARRWERMVASFVATGRTGGLGL